jgi:DNA adenine methylase
MTVSIVPYMGGKTKVAPWIVEHIPTHTNYVEPFGGSASVLLNKPRSQIEVFNDADGDVVNFFDVLRDQPDALAEYCRDIPFAEEIHNRWADDWFGGDRPDDDLKRAAVWMFLRYSSFNGKTGTKSGFKREPIVDARTGQVADTWKQAPRRIRETADRLQGVSIVNDDYAAVIDRYDDPNTVFYCDPPYVDKEHYYTEGVDHDTLADTLDDAAGDVILSYTDIPPGRYDDWTVISREVNHNAGGNVKTASEKLICNFDPSSRDRFVTENQTTLGDHTNA